MNGESGISFKELFNKDIDRNINGVIKANDEKNLNDEVNEYVLTEEICRNLVKFLFNVSSEAIINNLREMITKKIGYQLAARSWH